MDKNNTEQNPKIIVIVGPTASGKSDLGINLARKLRGEVISADSRQVYRGMNIGTGKVTKKEQELVKHHLLDVANPKKLFTASNFKELSEKAIKEIEGRNKIPIIVGGTGFYIDILVGRIQAAEVKPDKKLRAKLEKQSAEQLFKRLQKLDIRFSEIIDRHNKRRLIRALEIVIITGKPIPAQIPSNKYHILWLGINPGKEKLAQNIKVRLDRRLKQGILKEVQKLHRDGVNWKRLDDFGLEYRWISKFLREFSIFDFQFSKKEEIKKFKESPYYEILLREIIKYSKRQMTWFKKNKEIHWVKNNKTAEQLARQFIYS